MATYFAATVTVAYTAWLFFITSLTCGDSAGDTAEKCDVRVWYISKIGEGMFPMELTAEQQTIKTTIENMIQKSSTNPEDSLVDCSMLNTYESTFKPAPQNDGAESSSEESEDTAEEEESRQEEEDVEVDETEMADDDIDSEDTDDIDHDTSEHMAASSSSGAAHETIAVVKPALSSLWRKCRRQRSHQTAVSCVFVNTVTFQCFLQWSEEASTNADTAVKQDHTANGAKENQDKSEGSNADFKDDSRVKNDPETAPQTQEKNPENERKSEEEKPVMDESEKDDVEASKKDDKLSSGGEGSSKSQDVNGRHTRETPSATSAEDKPSAGNIDIIQFQQMIEKRASEYMLKIQTMETQIMRLENELLMEKLNKQNHTSSFSRLENQILKLENELLKMTLSYDELREENEKILKKQKSFLELDYVKRPGDFRRLPDNSTEQFELISQHQNKISELTDHLRNQSKLIDKIKGQSDSLEDQNRMLFQIVMNQTMLISQMMKKVESLSDSNIKHHMQQQLITDKLGIALASGDVMDALHSLVSDKFPLASVDANKAKTSESGAKKSSVKSGRVFVSLSQCNHPTRNSASCGFNSVILSQCLKSENFSVATNTPSSVPDFVEGKTENVAKAASNYTEKTPCDTLETSDLPSRDDKSGEETSDSLLQDGKSGGETSDSLFQDGKSGRETSDSLSQNAKSGDSVENVKGDNEDNTKGQPTKGNDRDDTRTDGKDEDGDKETRNKTDQNGTEETSNTGKASGKTTSNQNAEEQTKITQNVKNETTSEKNLMGEEATTKKAADETTERSRKPMPRKETSDSKTKKKSTSKQSDDKAKGGKKRVSKKENGKAEVSKKKKVNKVDSKKPKVERIPPLYNASRRAEPKDCSDYLRRGKQKDGLYKVKLYGSREMLSVFCDMKNGGWTVIQRRQDGTVNFFRTWDEYKKGFGGVYGEHWLGNDVIHRLTNQDQYELRVDLMDWEKTKKFAEYEYVRVDDEAAGYKLHVEGYRGDAGDGFSKHSGEKFSTKDRDNDRVVKEFDGSCANRFKGAWWYYKCYSSNLNGKFYKNGQIPEKQFDGITWKPWTGPNISLKKVEIKVRPINRKD